MQNTSFLKRLKLALLASGILFSPKAGHAMMKSEDEKSSRGFNSLLPAGPSNPFPASKAAPIAPDLSPLYQDIQHNIFDTFYSDPSSRPSFSPSKPLILEEGIVPDELQNRKDAIITLISLIKITELDSTRAITSREEESQNISNLIVQAFQLSAADIQKKFKAIERMVNLLSRDRAQPFVFGITAPFIEKLLSPNLNEHQITNRTIAIMDSAPFLLADATSSPDKKRRLVQSRLEKISFLFDLGTEQIVERASIMRTYFENKVVGYHHLSDPNRLTGRTYNEVLRNASSLDNRTLESRLGIIKSQVDTLKSLAGIKRESETLTATIIPQELSAYAAGLTLNNEDLVNRFNGIKDLFTPKKAEPANNFMDFLELYKTKIPLPSGGPAVGPSSSAS